MRESGCRHCLSRFAGNRATTAKQPAGTHPHSCESHAAKITIHEKIGMRKYQRTFLPNGSLMDVGKATTPLKASHCTQSQFLNPCFQRTPDAKSVQMIPVAIRALSGNSLDSW